jgi:uncharacterized membrane protein SirB2
MSSYLLIKHLHIGTAVISIGLFLLRAAWMLTESPRLKAPWVRVVPHLNDTLLLLFALVMVVRSGQYPFVDAWLTAKVLALLVYIVAGALALRYARGAARRRAWLVLALAAVAYIVAVALTRDAMPWRSW